MSHGDLTWGSEAAFKEGRECHICPNVPRLYCCLTNLWIEVCTHFVKVSTSCNTHLMNLYVWILAHPGYALLDGTSTCAVLPNIKKILKKYAFRKRTFRCSVKTGNLTWNFKNMFQTMIPSIITNNILYALPVYLSYSVLYSTLPVMVLLWPATYGGGWGTQTPQHQLKQLQDHNIPLPFNNPGSAPAMSLYNESFQKQV